MPRGKLQVLRSQSRKMAYNVLTFMKKEAEEGLQYDIKAVQKRAAAATGISVKSVRRIAEEAKKSTNPNVFRTPGKKRSAIKRVTGVDSDNQGIIRRCIHNYYYAENKLPSINELLKKFKKEIGFKGCASSLRRLLKELGFKWKRTVDNRKVLIEHTHIRLKRIEYLSTITKYRSEGRSIIFTGEFLHSANVTEGFKMGIGQRVVVVHACCEGGFIPNALFMFKTKLQDFHTNMDYEKWLLSHLIPNLPKNSVVVVGNAPYHNKLDDEVPTSNAKKSIMEMWLHENNIPFHSMMLKPELYKLICMHKEKYKKYKIDRILNDSNHTVLRLPPDHSDLNPIEMAWKAIKNHVERYNITEDVISNVMKLVEQKVNALDYKEWTGFSERVKIIEEEYKHSDIMVDNLTEELVIYISDSESEKEDESADSVKSYSSSDEES